MTKSDVQDIHRRARELATSGEFRGWQSVELRLREEGFVGVISALRDEFLRQELDAACKQAKTP
jgi:hypothetical protein